MAAEWTFRSGWNWLVINEDSDDVGAICLKEINKYSPITLCLRPSFLTNYGPSYLLNMMVSISCNALEVNRTRSFAPENLTEDSWIIDPFSNSSLKEDGSVFVCFRTLRISGSAWKSAGIKNITPSTGH